MFDRFTCAVLTSRLARQTDLVLSKLFARQTELRRCCQPLGFVDLTFLVSITTTGDGGREDYLMITNR